MRPAPMLLPNPDPPFALYPFNVNQDPPGDGSPFSGFGARWYGDR